METGERIKEARLRKGYSQDELAQKLGYKTRSSIAKIENGTNDIPQSKIVSIANALNTTPSYLMGWDSEESKTKNDSSIECTVSVANIDRVKTQILIVEQKLSELKDAIEELNKMSVEIEIQ